MGRLRSSTAATWPEGTHTSLVFQGRLLSCLAFIARAVPAGFLSFGFSRQEAVTQSQTRRNPFQHLPRTLTMLQICSYPRVALRVSTAKYASSQWARHWFPFLQLPIFSSFKFSSLWTISLDSSLTCLEGENEDKDKSFSTLTKSSGEPFWHS